MDRFKIERYFTSIGRSFYSGDEYRDLELEYKPISNFGIGFLSTFMICREIDVKTKYYMDEQEGLKLHIPNYDGCFFIEKDDSIDIGTEITLYIDKKISHNIIPDSIVDYISNVIKDITYDVKIENKISNKIIKICSHNLRREANPKGILFIPFSEDGKVKMDISLEEEIWPSRYISKYPYGLIVNINDDSSKWEGGVLNSGILLSETTIENIWNLLLHGEDREPHISRMYTFNFPSNYLKVDVSREKVTDFLSDILEDRFAEKLLEELYNQIIQLCTQSNPLNIIRNKLVSKRYSLFLHFNSDSVDLLVNHNNKKPFESLEYTRNNLKACQEKFKNFLRHNKIKLTNVEMTKSFMPIYTFTDKIEQRYKYSFYDTIDDPFTDWRKYVEKVFRIDNQDMTYCAILFIFLQYRDLRAQYFPEHLFLQILLQDISISDIETKKICIRITAQDIRKFIMHLNRNSIGVEI